MKDGRNKTGLNVIKEKPVANSQFAIINLVAREKDSMKQSMDGSVVSQLDLKPKDIKYKAFGNVHRSVDVVQHTRPTDVL